MPVTFSTASSLSIISPNEIITADVNNDGNLDLVTSYYSFDSRSAGFSVLLGNGAGQFGTPTNFNLPSAVQSIALADINGDGKLDLLAAGSSAPGSGFVSILLGGGTGNFTPTTNFPIDIGIPGTLATADFNQDGKLDVAVSGYGSYSFSPSEKDRTISVLLGDGTGQLSSPSNFLVGSINSVSSGLATADFNEDRIPDLAVHVFEPFGNRTSGTTILLGNGAGSFNNIGTFQTPSGGSNTKLSVADFNNDGKVDVVSQEYQKGTGAGQLELEESVYLYINKLAFADFNGDGKLDIAGTINSASSESILDSAGTILGDGSGRFSYSQVISSIKSAKGMTTGDFNKDGKLDLAVINDSSVFILLNTTVGTDAIVFSDSDKTIDASSELSGSLNIDLGQKTLRLGVIAQTISGDYDGIIGTRQADKISGSKNANSLSGEEGDDVLLGLDGNDRLAGGEGSDTLTGGKGKDQFEFIKGFSSYSLNASSANTVFNRSYGIDKITDFVPGQDKIILDRNVFANLKRRISFSTVKNLNEAKRSRSFITYIQSTGKLYYNQNEAKPGFGTGGVFADLSNNLELSVKDFQTQ